MRSANISKILVGTSFAQWRAIWWCRKQLFQIDQKLRAEGLEKTRVAMIGKTDQGVALFEGMTVKDTVRTVRRAARISIGASDTCLRRSLLLWWVLQQRGIKADLQYGVTSENGVLSGHAWVELDGRPVNDKPNMREIYQIVDLDRGV